ncbi:hypothetical protein THIOM_001967 [Candidatus Thiomargarita nelsonii]|uniref:Uncharacterized protein n=1 Tax=Candidatus Thiomargarita nelsonii TaxID=1003181 RepID=A0A176S2U2_9GAMM|nr:hypothetical protein THIOM_001967 [Candidatus Thiomargarita nelsonii]
MDEPNTPHSSKINLGLLPKYIYSTRNRKLGSPNKVNISIIYSGTPEIVAAILASVVRGPISAFLFLNKRLKNSSAIISC